MTLTPWQEKRDYYGAVTPLGLLVCHLVYHPTFSTEPLQLLLEHDCSTHGQGLLHKVMYQADAENAEAITKLLIPHVSVTEKVLWPRWTRASPVVSLSLGA